MIAFQDDTTQPKSVKVMTRVQPETIARFTQGSTQVLSRVRTGPNLYKPVICTKQNLEKLRICTQRAGLKKLGKTRIRTQRANSLTRCRTLLDNQPAVGALLAVLIRSQVKGYRPHLHAAFLYPSKTRAALCCAYFIMVGCIEQPVKRLAGSFAGTANLIHSTAQRFAAMGGGLSLYKGNPL